MKEDFKLLSVCIPTYNGAKYIEKNISTIIEQIQEYNLNNVEIVVSDNCSTDKIPQIMQNYVEKYPDIVRYSRNSENLGYDGNVVKCCEIAHGKFIHLFGDDDYYAPHGLKRLVDVLISNSDLSICVLSNFYRRDDNYAEYVSRKGLQNEFFLHDRRYINDSDNFIIELEDRAWPNSNLVFRKEYYSQIPNLKDFFKKDWIHFYILLYIAKKWPNCYIFADRYPIVIDRVGVQSWLNNNDGPRIYYNNLWTYSFADKLGYSKKVFDWYRKKLLEEYVKNIQFRRSRNFFENIKYSLKYFHYYKDCLNYYVKFLPRFLNIHKSIFNIVNYRLCKQKVKEKVIVLFGKEFRIKLERIHGNNIIFLHKLQAGEFFELSNSRGNLKQFVKGSVYKEINDFLKDKVGKNKFQKSFIKVMKQRQNKTLVPYSYYLADSYILNKEFNVKRGE